MQYISYDLTVHRESEKQYRKALEKKAGGDVEIREAKNGSIYLKPGNYKAVIHADGQKVIKAFEIKKQQKKTSRGKSG